MDDSDLSDAESDLPPRKLSINAVSSLKDLLQECQKSNILISEDTNRYMKYLIVKRIGIRTSQEMLRKLVEKGKIGWDSDGYEVEAILDYCKEDTEEGKEFYLIKWKGWSKKYNSWEPKEHLTCSDLMEEYHLLQQGINVYKGMKRKRTHSTDEGLREAKRRIVQDVDWQHVTPLEMLNACTGVQHNRFKGLTYTSGKPGLPHKKNFSYEPTAKSAVFRKRKQDVMYALKLWENEINAIEGKKSAYISVENNVDLEGPPANFEYIADYRAGKDVTIPDDPLIGCECENCVSEKKTCCAAASGCEFAYYSMGGIRLPPRSAIYECNKLCKCGPDCKNRVIQKGRKYRVCIFRTSNGMGWGVKAMARIKKGCFVMEYVGEIITEEEAERRGQEYDMQRQTYLFDLDYQMDEQLYTVDAGSCGNVAHFINHSCDPNLATYAVWINNLDVHMPRIAFFAIRDIEKGEELTFDYMMNRDHLHPKAASPVKDLTETNVPSSASVADVEANTTEVEDLVKHVKSIEPKDLLADNIVKESPFQEPVSVPDIPSPPPSDAEGLTDVLKLQREMSDTDSGMGLSVDVDKASNTSFSHQDEIKMDSTTSLKASPDFFRNKSPDQRKCITGRIKCLCGAANCRQFLF